MFSSSVQLSHHQLYAYSSSCNERFNLRYSVAIKVASKFLLLRFAIKIYVEGAVSRSNLDSMVNFFFPSFFFFFLSFFPPPPPPKLWSPTKARGQYHFYRGYESGKNTKPRIVWRDKIEHTNLERHYAAQGHCSRWEIKFKLSAGRIIHPAKKKISRIVITKKQTRSPYSPMLFQNSV